MRKSQDFSLTKKMLRLIGVAFRKSQRNSTAHEVQTTKAAPEKCVESFQLCCAHTCDPRICLLCCYTSSAPSSKPTRQPHVTNNEEEPNETKTNHKHWWPPSLPEKSTHSYGQKNNISVTFKCAQIIFQHTKTRFVHGQRQETPRTEKCATSHPQMQNRDWMFVILIGLNRTSFDLEM